MPKIFCCLYLGGSLLSLRVALVIFMLLQSVIVWALRRSFPWGSTFCVVSDVPLHWDDQKKGQGLSKLCSLLINVRKVRLEVRKFSSVNLTVITADHKVQSSFSIWMSRLVSSSQIVSWQQGPISSTLSFLGDLQNQSVWVSAVFFFLFFLPPELWQG